MALTILADRNIPHVVQAFSHLGPVRTMAGHAITPSALKAVDILLVRSVTPVNARILGKADVRFVGSATIGTDHIDRAFLAARGIAFAHARGAGAESVAEYVTAALLVVAGREKISLSTMTLGVVGCGNIGSRVARRAEALGMRVLRNDPPLADASGESRTFTAFGTLLRESDIVTLHVPLVHAGPYATGHLIGRSAFARMKPNAWLINTARGAVVDGTALKSALLKGTLGGAVLDVWEGEPTPDHTLMRAVSVATPHIAGHSYDGKLTGTIKLHEAVTKHFGLPAAWDHAALARLPAPLVLDPPRDTHDAAAWLGALTRQMYDLEKDDARTKALLTVPEADLGAHFRLLRSTYPRRRAFRLHRIASRRVPRALLMAVVDGLGVRLVP